ncbi:MAG: malto-oligosyltrehalose synthase, partial [Nocardioides sp.]
AYDDDAVRSIIDTSAERVAAPGWSNALSAKLVSLMIPGVPDVYQGSELWEQSLVDPDNRRFVDFDGRAGLLDSLGRGVDVSLTESADDPGAAKLLVTRAALTRRRDRPELFTTYAPVAASGTAADHVLAFDRGGAVTVATRLPVGLAVQGGWGTTALELPGGTWRDVITGAVATSSDDGPRLSEVLRSLPVALLVREDE